MADQSVNLSHVHLGDSGPPLLVLHGLFGAASNWRTIARGLSDCRSIWLLDARNHGNSPHSPVMTYATMANDLQNFMDQHDIERADILGHSMGGKTAMHFALRCPTRVSRLIVVDIAPARSPSDHLPLIDTLLELPIAQFKRRADADAALAASIADAGLRAFLLQNLTSTANGFEWRINLSVLRERMPDLLSFDINDGHQFSAPTLFIRGEQSDYLREEHHARITSLFPDARIQGIANAGHWVHAEQPEPFLQALREFLQCEAQPIG